MLVKLEGGENVQIDGGVEFVSVPTMDVFGDLLVLLELTPSVWATRVLHLSLLLDGESEVFGVELHKVVGNAHLLLEVRMERVHLSETYVLICLPFPEIRRGCCSQDLLGNIQEGSHLEDFALVDVSDELEVDYAISSLAEVTQVAVFVYWPCQTRFRDDMASVP